ncbi:MAG: hypothetical protein AAFY65_09520 [Pseudomonadota bacterium]
MFELSPTKYGADLPANFLPAALPVLQAGPGQITLPMVLADRATGIRMLSVPERTLAKPRAMAKIMADAGGGPNLGVPAEGPPPSEKAAAIGIIDTGIGFWNPVFSGAGTSEFEGMAFLEYDDQSSSFAAKTLSKGKLDAMKATGRLPGGHRKVRAQLGQRYPSSVYGPFDGKGPLLEADAFSHGTAMAHLAAGAASGPRPLFGLDLPAIVLRDSTGWLLQGAVAQAVTHLVKMMSKAVGPDAPFVVLLAFAFPGAPQDTQQAAAVTIARVLEGFADKGRSVTVIVPTGNHLRQRGHWVLPPARAKDAALQWRILPDDHSANTIDLLHREAEPPLTITAPDGSSARLSNAPVHLIKKGRDVVGAVWTSDAGDGAFRTRITLAPTAGPGAIRAPAGRWHIQLDTDKGASAWVIRDDTTLATRRLRPFRQSWFEDLAYRDRQANIWHAVDDDVHPDSHVRRLGTASVLAASGGARIVSVSAAWSPNGRDSFVAPYSGQFATDSGCTSAEEIVGHGRPYRGVPAVGTGTARRFRVNGTSVAAALHAGELA